jgi:hypothetical protein
MINKNFFSLSLSKNIVNGSTGVILNTCEKLAADTWLKDVSNELKHCFW